MGRFKVVVEYEGTRYRGWQIQENETTVQGELQRAAAAVFGTEDLLFHGAGRTDAGVHALAQTAHLEVQTKLNPRRILRLINDRLPADINVLDVQAARPEFDAQRDAIARSYLYQVSTRRTAMGKRFVWWIRNPLDWVRMRDAAGSFTGPHDFRSFMDTRALVSATTVEVEHLSVRRADDLILIQIRGSQFLWKMVRRIVGVLVEVGKGAFSPAEVERLFTDPGTVPGRLTAPPSGLFLERVYYPDDRAHLDATPVFRTRWAP